MIYRDKLYNLYIIFDLHNMDMIHYDYNNDLELFHIHENM